MLTKQETESLLSLSDSDLEAFFQLIDPEAADEIRLYLSSQSASASDPSSDPFNLKTLSEVAEFFGLAEQTIRTWRLQTPPMPGEPGRWPIKQIVQWRCAWIQQSDLAAAKRQQDYDLGQIQLETKKLELDREKGLSLDRQDVELWAATALVELREGVMQLPEMLAASVPQELKDFVRDETDKHCRDLLTATTRRLELAEIGKGGNSE